MNLDLDFLMGDDDEPEVKPEPAKPKRAPKKVKADSEVDESFCLSDRDHIRLRPDMYLGSVNVESHDRFIMGEYRPVFFVQGLAKIINEILDNSIDEAIRTEFKFANKIDVTITDTMITISDNGRGIPQDDVRTPSGDVVPKPVAAWTMAKSGSNFDDDNRVTMGMNGVGSFLTNCYSSLFIGETCDGKKKVTINCKDGALSTDYRVSPSKAQGTTVKFIPDFTMFNGVEHIDDETKLVIRDRLVALAVAFPDAKFTFNGEIMANRFKIYAGMYGQETITSTSPKISYILASTQDGFKQKSFVNGLDTKNGGVHVDALVGGLCTELIPAIKKKHKIDISAAQIKQSLTLVVFVHGYNAPAFDSQTKERMTNTVGDFNKHAGIDYAKLAKQVLATDPIIQPIIETALIRLQATEKAMLTKAKKAAQKVVIPKHVPANGLDDMDIKTTLFLTEGDSAVGQMIQCRDRDTQGAFPLRGKPLNTWGLNATTIMANKELSELMAILNLSLADKAIDDMTYDYIGIMVDADVDGGDILTLLVAFFSRWPELFKQEKILYIRTPIIICEIGKGEEWFYDLKEFEKVRNKAKNVRYIKGLGSLEKEDYSKVLTTQLKYDTIELGDNYKEILEMCFGEKSEPRKEWVSGTHEFSVKE